MLEWQYVGEAVDCNFRLQTLRIDTTLSCTDRFSNSIHIDIQIYRRSIPSLCRRITIQSIMRPQPPKMPRYLLIGAGLFAQQTYIPFLRSIEDDDRAKLVGVVEVHDQEATVRASTLTLFPVLDLLFVPQFTKTMPLAVEEALTHFAEHMEIDCAIISTESRAHKAYGLWALRQGHHVIMDKPITTRDNGSSDPHAAAGIADDYEELRDAYEALQLEKETCYLVQSPPAVSPGLPVPLRQHHPIPRTHRMPHHKHRLQPLRRHVADAARDPESGVPPLQVRLRQALAQRLPPPRRMHAVPQSQLAAAGQRGKRQTPRPHRGHEQIPDPGRFLHRVERAGLSTYLRLVVPGPRSRDNSRRTHKRDGEVDCTILITLSCGAHPVCLMQLNLQHNGFSRRAAVITGPDLCRGVGRVEHETHDIKCGPFQTITAETRKAHDKKLSIGRALGSIFGGENHFDAHVFRNQAVLRSTAPGVQSFTMDDILAMYPQETDVKQAILEERTDFLLGRKELQDLRSNLPGHDLSAHMMSAAYLSRVRKGLGLSSVVAIQLHDGGTRPSLVRD
ncbi:hypothetical protein BJX61DRAFT_526982 [Aspergillus egyptiacus]|nr:hypothetical protein BJX61DRAFT_526982 [Aspergillus egyptiacus]